MYSELESLRESLKRYITSTYHISHPTLVEIRDQLLDEPGAIAQRPYLESTAKYDAPDARTFAELDLPLKVSDFLTELGKGSRPLLFDPPYKHQSSAIELVCGRQPRDVVVTTGTGSGKTEAFLLPILARLAREASATPKQFQERAVRALLLYPMNALVNDQLARLRLLLGDDQVAHWFTERSGGPEGRPAKFGRYTGRALYPGAREEETSRHSNKLRSLVFYQGLEERAGEGDHEAAHLVSELKRLGRWPAKPSLNGELGGFTEWFGKRGRRWKDSSGRYQYTVERREDPELLIRQECQEAPPDLLVTNYSMLEYMLLRPVERSIFEASREYYAAHLDERFILVLDEAHLYRGAQGTEVALLIRRLLHRLGLTTDRLQVVCTSASFSREESARQFAAGLTGKQRTDFEVLSGEKVAKCPAGPGDRDTAETLASLELGAIREGSLIGRVEALRPLLESATLEAFRYRVRGSGEVELRGLDAELNSVRDVLELSPDLDTLTSIEFLLMTEVKAAGDATIEVFPTEGTGQALSDVYEVQFSGVNVRLREGADPLGRLLYSCLEPLPVTGRLLNLTSGATTAEDPEADPPGVGPAQELGALAARLFPALAPDLALNAADTLVELAAAARERPGASPLLPARVHAFFRGLPGLWACSDPKCTELAEASRGGPTGRLFAQPRRSCVCGARVYELYTCRDCGGAYFKTWSEDPARPRYLWADRAGSLDGEDEVLEAVYLALEQPLSQDAELVEMDVTTGRLFYEGVPAGERVRDVWKRPNGTEQGDDGDGGPGPGKFHQCARCSTKRKGLRQQYFIQDHVTKGEEPFSALVRAQLLEQPPRQGSSTPLRGRKSLIFSDGRQKASRLAGNLRSYSLRDSVRPLLLDGLETVGGWLQGQASLDYSYLALLASCARRGVHLRPERAPTFDEHLEVVRGLVQRPPDALALGDKRSELNNYAETEALYRAVYPVLTDPHTGVVALGLARPIPSMSEDETREFSALPAPPLQGIGDDQACREALLETWVLFAFSSCSVILPGTPGGWLDSREERGVKLRRTTGEFRSQLLALPGMTARWLNENLKERPNGRGGPWIEFLKRTFFTNKTAQGSFVKAEKVALELGDLGWVRCERCTAVQPRLPLFGEVCSVNIGRGTACGGTVVHLDPREDHVFRSRKGYYRELVERLRREGDRGYAPHPFVAAEHSAALNESGTARAIGWTEWHELRFQDLDIEGPEGQVGAGPVDVLSCTTTMEVGIDIGSLSAVALRNVPPGRANYQQRAGRAGRRGSSLATVITFCGADSHDQRFFADPAGMVSGPVDDPALNLDNRQIFERHAFALILSLFQLEAIPNVEQGGRADANLFSSLGSLEDFQLGGVGSFSFRGLERWLEQNSDALNTALLSIMPEEIPERESLARRLPEDLIARLARDGAGPIDPEDLEHASTEAPERGATVEGWDSLPAAEEGGDSEDGQGPTRDGRHNSREQSGSEPSGQLDVKKLLDRLFYTGLLPRYAFPTDVVALHVFDKQASSRYRPNFRFMPQQGLSQALTAYAPGREVWINGEKHFSFAIYSPFRRETRRAWAERKYYLECENCGYACKEDRDDVGAEQARDCPACGRRGALGPGIQWLRPPGFAQPVELDSQLASDESPDVTRATSAKLQAVEFLEVEEHQTQWGEHVRSWSSRKHLLVTNVGSKDPSRRGFRYCVFCGLAEPAGWENSAFRQATHTKPFPEFGREGPVCRGQATTISLGTEFLTDIALFRFQLTGGCSLPPGRAVTRVTLTTLAEALSAAAAGLMDVDSDEVQGEYRVAQTEAGAAGLEVEIFLYDLAAGGAGFVRAAAARPNELLDRAKVLLDSCDCDSSCYECLRSYRNKWDHGDLDRHLALALLEHCTGVGPPDIPSAVEDRLLRQLARELRDEGVGVDEGVPGVLTIIGSDREVVLGHPFSPRRPGSQRARERTEPTVLDQLIVERALPAAGRLARRSSVDAEEAWVLPGYLQRAQSPESGIPLFHLADLHGEVQGATPVCYVEESRLPPGAILVTLDERTRESLAKRIQSVEVVVMKPTPPDEFDDSDALLLLSLSAPGRVFTATGEHWTLGSPRERVSSGDYSQPSVLVTYSSPSPRFKWQRVRRADLRSVAKVIAVYQRGELKRLDRRS